ncbi:MAG: hypothetical protein ACI9T7_002076 [Oleiphilaceae bacterium]
MGQCISTNVGLSASILKTACLKMACNIVNKLRRFKGTRNWPVVKESVLSSLGMTDLDYQDLSEDIAEMFS